MVTDTKHGDVPLSQSLSLSAIRSGGSPPVTLLIYISQPARPRVDVNLIVGIIPRLTLTSHILAEIGLISRSQSYRSSYSPNTITQSVWGLAEQPILKSN